MLKLLNLFWHEWRCPAHWSNSSRKALLDALRLLHERLRPVLSPRCTHIKGGGGVKGAVSEIAAQIASFHFVARFDVASYYDSMQHRILLDLLAVGRSRWTGILERGSPALHRLYP